MALRALTSALASVLALALVGCATSPPATPGSSTLGVGPATSPPAAAGTGQPATPGTPSGVISGAPSRAALISQDVAAGRLDLVTALIYRAESALGLPGVPDQYLTGVPLRDDSVFDEMASLMPTLPPADQARFKPFLVRPTDPQSVFAVKPIALAGVPDVAEDTSVPAQCQKWADSGDLDSRFKVWACADEDAATAEIDIATIVALLKQIWDPMTVAEPDGMGEPIPDEYATSNPLDYGGDDRIDFYALDLGQNVYRNGPNQVPEDAVAAAQSTDPFTASGASSGFILLNRVRLANEREMKLDLIHEFFHVLQDAHTEQATHDHGLSHWFIEASATWAETFYDRTDSDEPHAWFPSDFQASTAGLEVADPDHKYAAYIWPFFMQQEKDSKAVFQAWSAIGQLGPGDFAGITQAISQQLSFTEHFRDFAVRNLNIDNILSSAGLPRYDQADGNFFGNYPPQHITEGRIQPGEPYISPPGGAPPLGADYYHFQVAENAREVTLSLANVTPASAVDGDALVHFVGGGWQRRPLEGGTLKFCRDNRSDDIDELYLVVSDHDVTNPLLGYIEASAKDSCSAPNYIGGRITWTAESHVKVGDIEQIGHVSGSMDVVIHVIDPYLLDVERGSGSTYNYDYDNNYNCAGSHESGTLESGAGVGDASLTDYSIGIFNALGQTGQDLPLQISIHDYCGGSMGSDLDKTVPSWDAFPDCEPRGDQLFARFDGTENYVINCDVIEWNGAANGLPGESVSGHVSGTLRPLNQSSPAPQ